MSDFIGRGENRVAKILRYLFPGNEVCPQMPIESIINREDYNALDERYQKHKFDLVLITANHDAVIEVNYKHKVGAARKWHNVFLPLLQKAGVLSVAVNDFECESIFDGKERDLCWQDYVDVINAFRIAKVRLEDLV